MMSNVFSIIFIIMNCLLANMVSNDIKENYCVSCFFMVGTVASFVFTDFKFNDMTANTVI